jgi:hypothetical protein
MGVRWHSVAGTYSSPYGRHRLHLSHPDRAYVGFRLLRRPWLGAIARRCVLPRSCPAAAEAVSRGASWTWRANPDATRSSSGRWNQGSARGPDSVERRQLLRGQRPAVYGDIIHLTNEPLAPGVMPVRR